MAKKTEVQKQPAYESVKSKKKASHDKDKLSKAPESNTKK
jgi:hypothetical protein